MKLAFALISAAVSFNVMAEDNKNENSVNVHNLAEIQKDIWVNGNIHSIKSDSSLWIPCLPEEKVELQFSEMLEVLTCGDVKELN